MLTVALSVGAIYASDANVTDSITADADDTSIAVNDDSSELQISESVDGESSNDVLQSEISSTLSTNTQDSDVLASDNSSNIDPSKTITAQDVTKYYKGSTKYTATFLDNNGTALANSDVNITYNGHTYTQKTNGNGVVSLSINLKPGTYKITATNPVSGYTLTTTFKILSTVSAKDVTKVYTDSKRFYAKFLKSNGKALANKKIKFKIKGKTYIRKTNSKGVASLSLTSLKKGTYKIISYNKDGLTKTNKVKVVRSAATTLTAKDYIFLKKDSKKIKVRLLDKYGHIPAKGQIINFKINGKKFSARTSKYGYATLKLPTLKNGVYTVKYSFAKTSIYKASSTKSRVTVISSKVPKFTLKSTKVFGHGAGTPFKIALSSKSVPLKGQTVKITVNGTTYTKTTNSNGIVSLPINLDIGNYTISYKNKATSKINAKSGSMNINVIKRTPTTVNWGTIISFNQGTRSAKLLVLDQNNKPISGATVQMNVNSKIYTAKTASNGYATFKVNFPVGNYSVTFNFLGNNLNAPSTGSVMLNVLKVNTISLNSIIQGSSNLKNYYANYGSLPGTVSAGGISFTVPEFLYLMSQAIVELGNSNTGDITYISDVSAPASPNGDSINANLQKNNFLTVANNVATYISNHKQAPNYAASVLGKISFEELVDAEARIVAYYGDHDQLPNYVTISSGATITQSGTGLNEKNTLNDVSALLKATKNCQVNNAAIKNIVAKVTKGLTSDSAKAKAIYNYVRDKIAYSFYYDTKHGAVGTLNAGSGNCVDQAHLLVAMFRAAKLPARYVHGTCKFSSGSTYGHVWTQVLIGNKWTVADATSGRNSLGTIVNWNTKSFSLKGIYSAISF